MGEVSTVLVTGAAGFVGAAVVRAARARGHRVRAVVRRVDAAPPEWRADPDIETIALDLSDPGTSQPLFAALQDVQAVVHAAASLSGDDATHQADTLNATTRVLTALKGQKTRPRMVLVSSLSVYAGDGTPEGGVVNEATALETRLRERDAYCRAKLAQENLARTAGRELWILRVGAIYGPDRWWNAHLGVRLGPVLLRLGATGEIPLCHIDNCANALVLATETPVPAPGMDVVNVVDDDLPDRLQFLAALGRQRPPLTLPLSWKLLMVPAMLGRLVPGLSSRLPGLLRPATLQARLRPVRYSNQHLKSVLGWTPAQQLAASFPAVSDAEVGNVI